MISTVTVERIVISVTSSDLGDADAVVQAVSSKGSDQADVILSLLEYSDIVDQIFAVCWDTTSSSSSILWSNCVALHKILNTPLLWFLCTCWQNTSLTSLGHSLDRRPRPPEGAVCQTSEGLANNQE
jgi:hypothetical protein